MRSSVPVLALLLAAAACDDSRSAPNASPNTNNNDCTPGRQVACTCGNGAPGSQVCRNDRTFSACGCNGPVDAGPLPDVGSLPDFGVIGGDTGARDTGVRPDGGVPPPRDTGVGMDAVVPPDPDAGPVDSGVMPSVVETIAGIQDPNAPDRPAMTCRNDDGNTPMGVCARARLRGVVVTAIGGYVSRNLRALWVQDPRDPDGRYAGVKVVYPWMTPPFPNGTPVVGSIVDVDGEVMEYRFGTQVQFATVTVIGSAAPPPPVAVSPASILARSPGNPRGYEYEGVLVRVDNVRVVQRCVEDDFGRDFGEFTVTGDVQVGTAWPISYTGMPRPATVMCTNMDGTSTGLCACTAMSRANDLRTPGDLFTSITGVFDFVFGEFVLEPRDDNDLLR